MEERTTVVVINEPEKYERRLRNIEHRLENLFSILDNLDDIGDILVANEQMIGQLRAIAPETTNGGTK